jgi:hypothetical protein
MVLRETRGTTDDAVRRTPGRDSKMAIVKAQQQRLVGEGNENTVDEG